MSKYQTVIGMEVHAELMTDSKMFCGCKVVDSVEAEPNTAVCPICLGMPGMMPVMNKQAIEYAMLVGLALNCEIQEHNIFARKNYFYPDLPKSYQVTQFEEPIALNGYVDVTLADGTEKRIRVRRVHMEEDTGKLTHLGDGSSLVDYNRSTVPLLEIVSEPDIHSAEEAYEYGKKLRQLVRYLGVNAGDMEKGVLRMEPNISIRIMGTDDLNTRTEIKNLNSLRAVLNGSEYEVKRQTKLVESGGEVIQETRGWNDSTKKTVAQRRKETADDYRYFPEPDLVPLNIDADWIERIRATLPELPDAKLARYLADYSLSEYEAGVLTEDRTTAEWYETAVSAGGDPKAVANWMLNNLFTLLNESGQEISDIAVTPASLVDLIRFVSNKTINNNTAKEVLADMFASGDSAKAIIDKKGLAQISDEGAIEAIVNQILDDNPDEVAKVLEGNDKLKGWFVGQVMKASKGKANPGVANKLLSKAFAERQS